MRNNITSVHKGLLALPFKADDTRAHVNHARELILIPPQELSHCLYMYIYCTHQAEYNPNVAQLVLAK